MNQPAKTEVTEEAVTESAEPSNVTSLTDAVNQQAATDQSPGNSGTANVGLIMDIPVTVSMELGRTRISIRELLSMNPGAVISLDRLASDPMEILVNGTLVAHGEAVKVGDRFGVRLTHVVNTADRLKQAND